MTRFAAYSADTIVGIGKTELAAINDALEACPREDNGDGLATAPMTPALLDLVEGGVCDAFRMLHDGRLGTVDEGRDDA